MYYIYIDEAWRGPLAWPVQVGLIIEKVDVSLTIRDSLDIFPAKNLLLYQDYKDSKVLSEWDRNHLYKKILDSWSIEYVTAKSSALDIDRHWIVRSLRNAILRAMHTFFVWGKYSITSLKQRLASIHHQVTIVVDWPSDFWLRKVLGVTVIPVIDGDAKIPMISAGSIIAKVERDAYMYRAAKRYPKYSFNLHKWYGTKWHYEAITQYWLCKEHRKSYIHQK